MTHKNDLLLGALSSRRVYGWRGWLHPGENIRRLATGTPEPWWSYLYWRAYGFFKVGSRDLTCRIAGHKPKVHSTFGRYCERCLEDL